MKIILASLQWGQAVEALVQGDCLRCGASPQPQEGWQGQACILHLILAQFVWG